MKIYKDWDGDKDVTFVVFLAKELKLQKRTMRKIYNKATENCDIEALKMYTVQCGVAAQTGSLYEIAKHHFNLDKFKRKHIVNNLTQKPHSND